MEHQGHRPVGRPRFITQVLGGKYALIPFATLLMVSAALALAEHAKPSQTDGQNVGVTLDGGSPALAPAGESNNRVAADAGPVAPDPTPPQEVCDGIDNDGNGVVDEGCDQTCDVPDNLGPEGLVSNLDGPYDFHSLIWTGSEYAIAWDDIRDGNDEIYFARLDANGTRIGAEHRITDNPGSSWVPSLASDGSEFAVAWFDVRSFHGYLLFRRLDATGTPIASEVIVNPPSAAPVQPALVWNGTEYGLAWDDITPLYGGIWFTRLDALGVILGTEMSVRWPKARSPAIAWMGSGYGMVYYDTRDGNQEIYFTRLYADGTPIGSETRITNNLAYSGAPVIAWTGTGYGIAWEDLQDGKSQIFFTRLDAFGNKLGSDLSITSITDISRVPQLVWNGTEYGLTWASDASGQTEIYFARIDAMGNKIGSNLRVTSDDGAPSYAPASRWNGVDYGLVFLDDRGGSRALYYTELGCCNDVDQDGSSDCRDCDDSNPAIFPGAEQICGDAINNDCNHPNWPALAGTNEVDDDGDGLTECAGDCDDANPVVYPGAPEICDGLNDNCSAPGWPAIPPDEVNQDQDAYPLCNDCNDQNALVYPGAPQLCDGINNDCTAPGWPAIPPNEVDQDQDAHPSCNDCNDQNALVFPGAPQLCDGINNDCSAPGWPAVPMTEQDLDGDGRIACGDCNDSNPAIFPGAPQLCGDGVNNDCNHPSWPSLVGTNEVDDDGDGVSECTLDCDDANASTFPGAAEINDGKDNECPGEPGFGANDEVSGLTGFLNPADPNELSWSPQEGAGSYEVARSGNPYPSPSPFFQSTFSNVNTSVDSAVPPVNGHFFYLVRPAGPFVGSWGQRSDGQERVGFASPESDCGDGIDNDADGQVDCADPDCVTATQCAPSTLTFMDTPGDDLPPTGLSAFFQGLSATPSDYIFFSLSGPGLVDFAFCAERADFYRDSYLSMMLSGGSSFSGSWNRWVQVEGSPWSDALTSSYASLFGPDCVEEYAWCPESGLANRYLAVLPARMDECEAVDMDVGCGPGNWTLTIRVGAHRLPTCGF